MAWCELDEKAANVVCGDRSCGGLLSTLLSNAISGDHGQGRNLDVDWWSWYNSNSRLLSCKESEHCAQGMRPTDALKAIVS